jgi:menaquinone-9 beta-reductase
MPTRATKRGADRTPLDSDAEVLICGASFAGLAVARELADAGAEVLVVDRYEVGERQTSACAAPTAWLQNLDLHASVQQTFDSLLFHTPRGDVRWALPWPFSTFDYRTLCAELHAQGDARFEIAKVEERTARGVRTDRGELRAPLVVDALGWRRHLASGPNVQPPEARLSRGLEVHPDNRIPPARDLELWLDPAYVRAGYSWSFPADHELRVGVGSFDPRDHVKEPTVRLARDVDVPSVRFQGNWIPHRLRPAADGRTFFVGDSAGHCLPTTAEGIRPAFYFGLACGRELRAVVEGRRDGAEAMARYAAFSRAHRWKYEALFRVQQLVGHVNPHPHAMRAWLRALTPPPLTAWAFAHYLNIAPPEFALSGDRRRGAAPAPRAVAA